MVHVGVEVKGFTSFKNKNKPENKKPHQARTRFCSCLLFPVC